MSAANARRVAFFGAEVDVPRSLSYSGEGDGAYDPHTWMRPDGITNEERARLVRERTEALGGTTEAIRERISSDIWNRKV